jgi:light-regulated signal transduction histidine kinase (bacteriophytochrome)
MVRFRRDTVAGRGVFVRELTIGVVGLGALGAVGFVGYSRPETAETRSIRGTSLSLPIVRQIVQLREGKVWATSESGQGSVFHVQLPLLEAAAQSPLTA